MLEREDARDILNLFDGMTRLRINEPSNKKQMSIVWFAREQHVIETPLWRFYCIVIIPILVYKLQFAAY